MFSVTGKIIKDDNSDLLEFGGKRTTYYTAQEEFEYYCKELTDQQQRQAYAKIREDKEPYLLTALEVVPSGVGKEKILKLISDSMNQYATSRIQAEAMITKRREEIDNILKATTNQKSQANRQHKSKKERKNDGGEPLTEDEFFN